MRANLRADISQSLWDAHMDVWDSIGTIRAVSMIAEISKWALIGEMATLLGQLDASNPNRPQFLRNCTAENDAFRSWLRQASRIRFVLSARPNGSGMRLVKLEPGELPKPLPPEEMVIELHVHFFRPNSHQDFASIRMNYECSTGSMTWSSTEK